MNRSQNQIFDGTAEGIFLNQKNLGSYAKVSFFRPQGSGHIIYDAKAPWVQEQIKKSLGTLPEAMTVEQIRKVLKGMLWRLRLNKASELLSFQKSAVKDHYYFDELGTLTQETDLVLILLAKLLFENYTKMDSRIVSLEKCSGQSASFVLVVKGLSKGANVIFDVTQRLGLNFEKLEQGLLLGKFRLSQNSVMITQPSGVWTTQKKSLSVFDKFGKELHFQITGRTPAEKRFEKDEELINSATGNQLVPIEINFHPFWRPLGHTTLRIGRSLYELSATGWKAHNSGANTARAFIFNNPFFRKQLGLFADQGMPPMSLGVTLMVAKEKVDVLLVILENLAAAQGPNKEKFSLIKNNCNQGIVRVLTQAGIEGFDHKGYLEFSTILTYREVLLTPAHPIEGLRLYPLPNTTFDEATARAWISALLYRHNSVSLELRRALPIFPRDYIYINWKRFVNFIQKSGGRNVADI